MNTQEFRDRVRSALAEPMDVEALRRLRDILRCTEPKRWPRPWIPNRYAAGDIDGIEAGWDDAAALASEGLVAAERSHAATALSPSEVASSTDEPLAPTHTAANCWHEADDSAARDAREAADVLRVVEAAEAAEAAAAAMAAGDATKEHIASFSVANVALPTQSCPRPSATDL